MLERTAEPIGMSFYPREFWSEVASLAKNPTLQRIAASADCLDAREQRFILAYVRAIMRADAGDFIGERDGQLGPLADALLTTDRGARGRVLDRFEAWSREHAEAT
jgi:hypothetical protein